MERYPLLLLQLVYNGVSVFGFDIPLLILFRLPERMAPSYLLCSRGSRKRPGKRIPVGYTRCTR